MPCVLIKLLNSDKRGLKKHSKGLQYISRHRRAAHSLPTKSKLLSLSHLDYVANLPKRHLDTIPSSRFTKGRIWPNCLLNNGLSFLTCSASSGVLEDGQRLCLIYIYISYTPIISLNRLPSLNNSSASSALPLGNAATADE